MTGYIHMSDKQVIINSQQKQHNIDVCNSYHGRISLLG